MSFVVFLSIDLFVFLFIYIPSVYQISYLLSISFLEKYCIYLIRSILALVPKILKETILNLDYVFFHMIVCDNNSCLFKCKNRSRLIPIFLSTAYSELLKDDKDKDKKRAATQAAFKRKFKKNSDFWVYEKKIRLVIRKVNK